MQQTRRTNCHQQTVHGGLGNVGYGVVGLWGKVRHGVGQQESSKPMNGSNARCVGLCGVRVCRFKGPWKRKVRPCGARVVGNAMFGELPCVNITVWCVSTWSM